MIKLNMNLPPDIARRFVEDMEAFYAEPNAIKQDEIAARQLHILREHRKPRDPKLRLGPLSPIILVRMHPNVRCDLALLR
jgi:hypothetical protein